MLIRLTFIILSLRKEEKGVKIRSGKIGNHDQPNIKPAERYDIFVISEDVVCEKMAGPGIRAWELSRLLAKGFGVILAVPIIPRSERRSVF